MVVVSWELPLSLNGSKDKNDKLQVPLTFGTGVRQIDKGLLVVDLS